MLWLALGVGLHLVGLMIGPHTEVEVHSDGGRVKLSVAGSELATTLAVEAVHRVVITAMDSPYPPGGRSVEIAVSGRTILVDPLPRRFSLPSGEIPPLGDWELDELAGKGVVYDRQVDISGPFGLRALFTGRVHHHLSIAFDGSPSFSVSFRRGMLNNDMFIMDGDGATVAATSIDPRPGRDLLAALSIVADATAAAALLIALLSVVHGLARTDQTPHRAARPGRSGAALIAAVALAVLATTISVWVATGVLERLPHLPDSVVYLLQAGWLLEGRLFQEVSAIQQHLTVPLTHVVDGRWVAHYPFGWPLLLASGVALGKPWLVAPALAALYTLLLFAIGRELFTPTTALAATALAVASPISCLLFASMLAHAGSSTLILLFLWLLLVGRRTGSGAAAVAAGLAVGFAFGVRPLVAVAVAVPVGGFMVLDAGRGVAAHRAARVLVGVVIGGLLGVLPTLASNLLVTGSPLSFPYSLVQGSMYGASNVAFGIRNMDALLASTMPALYGWGWGYASSWIFMGLPLAFALVPFLLRRQNAYDLMLAGCLVAVVVAHLPAQSHGLHGFGPRYYFDAFFAIYLLTARGFQELARIGAGPVDAARPERISGATRVLAVSLFVALVGSAAVMLPTRLAMYRGYNRVDRSLQDQAAALGVDRGLIMFAEHDWRDWARAAPLRCADPRADLVCAERLDDDTALIELYPDRPVYLWRDATLAPIAALPEPTP